MLNLLRTIVISCDLIKRSLNDISVNPATQIRQCRDRDALSIAICLPEQIPVGSRLGATGGLKT